MNNPYYFSSQMKNYINKLWKRRRAIWIPVLKNHQENRLNKIILTSNWNKPNKIKIRARRPSNHLQTISKAKIRTQIRKAIATPTAKYKIPSKKMMRNLIRMMTSKKWVQTTRIEEEWENQRFPRIKWMMRGYRLRYHRLMKVHRKRYKDKIWSYMTALWQSKEKPDLCLSLSEAVDK